MMKIMFYKPGYGTKLVDDAFNNKFSKRVIDITDPWVIRILKEVDKVEPLAPNIFKIIDKEWYVNYEQLSSGCKALLMIYYQFDYILDLCMVWNNCNKLLADLSLIRDFTVECHVSPIHLIGYDIHVLCLNDGKEFFDGREMWNNAYKYKREFNKIIERRLQEIEEYTRENK